MTQDEPWEHLAALDDELLMGGVILSEWCSLIVRDADTAFASGAYLAAILTAVSGIETHLRSEQLIPRRERLADLIDNADISAELKADLHALRKYRNKWVHVDFPRDDEALLENPKATEDELEWMAYFAIRTLRRTIYAKPWV
jgi:hypothetical protein